MNTTQTLTKLNQMRLYGMENALRTVLETKADYKGEELAAYLAESEWNERESRKMNRYLSKAGFRYPASVEEVDFLHPTGTGSVPLHRTGRLQLPQTAGRHPAHRTDRNR